MPFENWESDNKTSYIKWFIIGLILLVACAGTVSAIYHITSPPSDTVTVTETQTLSRPTVSATSMTVGETLTISTTLMDGLSGVQVSFFENGNLIGNDFTDDTGTATYNRVMTSAGSYTYFADCIHP